MRKFAYNFITTWKFRAPLPQVWQLVHDNEDWPEWWKGVLKSDTIEEGDEDEIGKVVNFIWKSLLPYTLNFNVISSFVEPPFILEGLAYGDVKGKGKWWLEEEDGITTVKLVWSVDMNKAWMNRMAFLLKPLFLWNHNIIMAWGAKGLAKKLNCQLVSQLTEFHRRQR